MYTVFSVVGVGTFCDDADLHDVKTRDKVTVRNNVFFKRTPKNHAPNRASTEAFLIYPRNGGIIQNVYYLSTKYYRHMPTKNQSTYTKQPIFPQRKKLLDQLSEQLHIFALPDAQFMAVEGISYIIWAAKVIS